MLYLDERGWTPWSPWSLCELTPPSITDKVRAGEKTAAESSTSKCNQQRKRDCTLDFLAPDTGQVGVDSKCVGDAYQLRPCDEADCEVVVVAPGGQKDGSGDRTGEGQVIDGKGKGKGKKEDYPWPNTLAPDARSESLARRIFAT